VILFCGRPVGSKLMTSIWCSLGLNSSSDRAILKFFRLQELLPAGVAPVGDVRTRLHLCPRQVGRPGAHHPPRPGGAQTAVAWVLAPPVPSAPAAHRLGMRVWRR